MFKNGNRSSPKVKISLTFKGIYIKPKEMISLHIYMFYSFPIFRCEIILKELLLYSKPFTLNVKEPVFSVT